MGLRSWWYGQDIQVEITDLRNSYAGWVFAHTVVRCPDGSIRYVMGHLGQPGDTITVNTWDLGKFE